MKNILVPTDFSNCSSNAFRFAKEIALYLEGVIHLVNVVHPNISTSYPVVVGDFDDLIKEHEIQLRKFEAQVNHEMTKGVDVLPKVDLQVLSGFAVDEIVKLSDSDDVDLIIMGMTGSSGLLDRVFGSVSSSVIQKTKCPVLLIPEDVNFQDFRNILYASDFISSSNKVLEDLVDFASLFEAKLHVAHVQSKVTPANFELEELILDQIVNDKINSIDVKYATLLDRDIWHAVDVYSKEFVIDLLVLVRPDRDFWKDVFHVSITSKIAKLIDRPLLIFPVIIK